METLLVEVGAGGGEGYGAGQGRGNGGTCELNSEINGKIRWKPSLIGRVNWARSTKGPEECAW